MYGTIRNINPLKVEINAINIAFIYPFFNFFSIEVVARYDMISSNCRNKLKAIIETAR